MTTKFKKKQKTKTVSNNNTEGNRGHVPKNSWVTLGEAGGSDADLASALKVKGYRDQHSMPFARVKNPLGEYWFAATDMNGDQSKIFKELGRLGEIFGQAKKIRFLRTIERLQYLSKCYSVQTPGYVFDEGSAFYVTAGHEVIVAPDGRKPPPLAIAFPLNANMHAHGDLEKYKKQLAPLVYRQSLPLLALGFSLTPLLLPFLTDQYYVENTVLEFCGDTTSFKSALLTALASSVWGTGTTKTRFAGVWNTTDNALEQKFYLYNHTLLGVDETTSGKDNAQARSAMQSNITHRFSSEQIKERMGESQSPTFRSMMMTTTNQSIWAHSSESEAVQAGVAVRLPTAYIPKGSTIFDTTPKGFSSAQRAQAELHNIANRHYGLLAPAFIKALLTAYGEDPKKLQRAIKSLMRQFLSKNGIGDDNPVAFRTAKPIALSFAALVLAKKWDCLPKEIGSTLKYVSKAYRTINAPPNNRLVDAIEPFLNYACQNVEKVIVVTDSNKQKLNDKQFHAVPCFIYYGADQQPNLAITRHKIQEIPNWKSHLTSLHRMGRLKTDVDGWQPKCALRVTGTERKAKEDRAYRIILDQWPL